MRSRNRQIKELKKQSVIAPRNDYDLVEGNEKSHSHLAVTAETVP